MAEDGRMGLAAVLTKEMLPVIQVLPESLCRIYARAEFTVDWGI